MTLEELIEMGIEEDTAKKVIKSFEKQSETIDKLTKDNEGLNTVVNELKTQNENSINELKNENQNSLNDLMAKFKSIQVENAIDKSLEMAINKDVVKPLIKVNMDEVELDENLKLKDFDIATQVEDLKNGENTAFLFKSTDINITGANPNQDDNNNVGNVDWEDLPYAEQVEYLKTHNVE